MEKMRIECVADPLKNLQSKTIMPEYKYEYRCAECKSVLSGKDNRTITRHEASRKHKTKRTYRTDRTKIPMHSPTNALDINNVSVEINAWSIYHNSTIKTLYLWR
jgi:hypothetical protein